jgi:serine/threonine-protein kinase
VPLTPSQIGRYKVIRPIGQGGMGSLFLAWDPKLGRHTAIKLLDDDDPELRERFAREARAAASIRHAHIVAIFDVGEHDGRPFIAMEYVHGQTLGALIKNRSDLSVARVVDIVDQLCDGLGFAHRAGIIHRDIKPANVMVDQEGAVKLLDFGVARASAASRMTRAGVLIGTLNYLSPEQVAGRTIDHRSDIFAVGLVFYELLAHRQAFAGTILGGILNKIMNEAPEPLAEIRRGLHAGVIHIVNRAIAKNPDERYQDLASMRRDLQQMRRHLQAGESPTQAFDVRTAQAAAAAAPTASLSGQDRTEILKMRSLRIQAHLEAGRAAMARSDYRAAQQAAEEALVLDTEDARALELLIQARARLSGG